jgi:hypothetical protein
MRAQLIALALALAVAVCDVPIAAAGGIPHP